MRDNRKRRKWRLWSAFSAWRGREPLPPTLDAVGVLVGASAFNCEGAGLALGCNVVDLGLGSSLLPLAVDAEGSPEESFNAGKFARSFSDA